MQQHEELGTRVGQQQTCIRTITECVVVGERLGKSVKETHLERSRAL